MNESLEEIRSALSVVQHNAADLARRVAALERLCGEAKAWISVYLAPMPSGDAYDKALDMYNKLRAAAEGKDIA